MKRLPCILLLLHHCSAIFLEDARWSEERITADSLCAYSEEELSEEGIDRYFEHTVYPRRARFISSSVSSERTTVSASFAQTRKPFKPGMSSGRTISWVLQSRKCRVMVTFMKAAFGVPGRRKQIPSAGIAVL